jgi:uncharacterized membrane protein
LALSAALVRGVAAAAMAGVAANLLGPGLESRKATCHTGTFSAGPHPTERYQARGGIAMITRNPKTTAQIAGHPLHPMLIPFPVAFLVATFVCDLIFWNTRNPAWSTASLWLLGAALVMAALAALAGLTDFLGDSRIRSLSAAWHHMLGNVVAVLLSLWNWYRRYEAGDAAVVPTGLLISLLVVMILLYTGWRGWEMVYRHRVAVSDEVT